MAMGNRGHTRISFLDIEINFPYFLATPAFEKNIG